MPRLKHTLMKNEAVNTGLLVLAKGRPSPGWDSFIKAEVSCKNWESSTPWGRRGRTFKKASVTDQHQINLAASEYSLLARCPVASSYSAQHSELNPPEVIWDSERFVIA